MQSSQSSCGIFIQLKSCECKVPMRYLDKTSSSTTKMMRHHFIVSPLICHGTPCHLCYCHYLSSSTKPLKNRSKRCVSFKLYDITFRILVSFPMHHQIIRASTHNLHVLVQSWQVILWTFYSLKSCKVLRRSNSLNMRHNHNFMVPPIVLNLIGSLETL